MFDRLIDFIVSQINELLPFRFVYQYHNGAKYRRGKFIKVCDPGWWWKIPWIDKIYTENITDTTILLPTQTIPCKDAELVVRGCIGYYISNIAGWFNNVNDTKSAISDNTYRIIRSVISSLSVEEIKKSIILMEGEKDADLEEVLCALVQKEVNNYGITIRFVSLVEISTARSYKLWNENIRLES